MRSKASPGPSPPGSSASPRSIVLQGAGDEGRGEDVTYEAPAHDAQQAAGPVLDLAGDFTFDSFSERLATLDTFPDYTPEQPVYRNYRRWGVRVGGAGPRAAPGGHVAARDPRAHRGAGHVRGLRADGRAADDRPGHRRLAAYPTLRFKLDATPDWPEELIDRAAADRRGRLDRLQGRLQGHGRRRRHRPGLLQAHRGVVPGRVARGPRPRDRGGAQRARDAPGPDHLGRADPLGRGHPEGAGDAAHGQPQAVPVRQREGAVRGL